MKEVGMLLNVIPNTYEYKKIKNFLKRRLMLTNIEIYNKYFSKKGGV